MSFQFTRYLYEKKEVMLSLMLGLLNKKESVLFWAYELYYSGFERELIQIIWNVYYDFYAILNISFEKYLSTKLHNLDEKSVASIIQNLMIRSCTVDVFILRQITDHINFNYTYDPNDDTILVILLNTEDYLQISYFVLNTTNILNRFAVILNYFKNRMLILDDKKEIDKFKKAIKIHELRAKNIILLSRVVYYFTLLKNIKQCKNLFICIDPSTINMYETIESIEKSNLKARQILPKARTYSIDDDISLFYLKRDKHDIVKAYRENWEYYASFSPLWLKRIKQYNGRIYENEVIFEDDDIDVFYERYGLDPDEQNQVTQEKSIKQIRKTKTWQEVLSSHKKILTIPDKYLNLLNKLYY